MEGCMWKYNILDKKIWVNCGFNFVGNGWQ
jgi:hypothetical protein